MEKLSFAGFGDCVACWSKTFEHLVLEEATDEENEVRLQDNDIKLIKE